jgi:hypothetical protein
MKGKKIREFITHGEPPERICGSEIGGQALQTILLKNFSIDLRMHELLKRESPVYDGLYAYCQNIEERKSTS